MLYQLAPYGVLRLIDTTHIPNAEGNRDWETYLEWLAAGGEPLPEQDSTDQLIAEMLARRDSLLREAATRIAPLQYAVDLGDATPEEDAALLSWKRYSVALSRVEQQSGFPAEIDWPRSPGTPIAR